MCRLGCLQMFGAWLRVLRMRYNKPNLYSNRFNLSYKMAKQSHIHILSYLPMFAIIRKHQIASIGGVDREKVLL